MIKTTLLNKTLDNMGVKYEVRKITKGSKDLTGYLFGETKEGIPIPCIYIENYLNGFDGNYKDLALQMICDSKTYSSPIDDMVEHISDWGWVKSRVFYAVEPRTETNKPYITSSIYDLDVYFQVVIPLKEGKRISVRVTDEYMDDWGIDFSTLCKNASSNTFNSAVIQSLEALMIGDVSYFNLSSIDEIDDCKDVPMYVVTTEDRVNGAGVIASPMILDHICRILNTEEIYIIPSCVHEIIVVKPGDDVSIEELLNMNVFANIEAVDEEDFLANNIYTYSIINGKFKAFNR